MGISQYLSVIAKVRKGNGKILKDINSIDSPHHLTGVQGAGVRSCNITFLPSGYRSFQLV